MYDILSSVIYVEFSNFVAELLDNTSWSNIFESLSNAKSRKFVRKMIKIASARQLFFRYLYMIFRNSHEKY